jgi:predicted GNAT family acetyltransferase
MLQSKTQSPLDAHACQQLADALGETPRTALVYNALRTGQCIAFASGQFGTASYALVVELTILPGEPAAFASHASTLWALLQQLEGWWCVCAEAELARPLGQRMQEAGEHIRFYEDIAYELRNFVPHSHPHVRLLTPADLPLLLAAKSLTLFGEAQHTALLQHSLEAGAVVEGALVALADVDSPTGRYAEVGVSTDEAHRNQGYATAAASLVIQQVLAQGRIPNWSTGQDNYASQRVAAKLGYVEVRRSLYVIRESPITNP